MNKCCKGDYYKEYTTEEIDMKTVSEFKVWLNRIYDLSEEINYHFQNDSLSQGFFLLGSLQTSIGNRIRGLETFQSEDEEKDEDDDSFYTEELDELKVSLKSLLDEILKHKKMK